MHLHGSEQHCIHSHNTTDILPSAWTIVKEITCEMENYCWLITVADRSKTWVCGHSLAGIAVSNPAGGTDVCRECCVCVCVIR